MSDFWFEHLPEGCPPIDAINANGIVYRLANNIPTDVTDFYSQRKLRPNHVFKDVDECIARSLSVFDNLEAAKIRLKLPKFKNSHVLEISLSEDDGRMKKTFGPNHHSWWLSTKFNLSKCKILQ